MSGVMGTKALRHFGKAGSIPRFYLGVCQRNQLPLHFIADSKQRIIHLTFSRERHDTAIEQLQSALPASVFLQNKMYQRNISEIIAAYMQGRLQKLPFPICSPFFERGTVFQKSVWRLLYRIPYGITKTYGELAAELGNSKSARAVGQACHLNPLALIIPCHRVVGASKLGGYAGGAWIKERLIALEKGGKFDKYPVNP